MESAIVGMGNDSAIVGMGTHVSERWPFEVLPPLTWPDGSEALPSVSMSGGGGFSDFFPSPHPD